MRCRQWQLGQEYPPDHAVAAGMHHWLGLLCAVPHERLACMIIVQANRECKSWLLFEMMCVDLDGCCLDVFGLSVTMAI